MWNLRVKPPAGWGLLSARIIQLHRKHVTYYVTNVGVR